MELELMEEVSQGRRCLECEAELLPYGGRGRPKSKCDACVKAKAQLAAKNWSAANRERHRELQRRWQARNRIDLNQRNRERYWADPEQGRKESRESVARHRARNPEAVKQYQKDYYETRPGKKRATNLWAHYRMTPEDYELMLHFQGGGCKICGSKDPKMRSPAFHVDHCHETGKIRGLLCGPCNVGLGAFSDNIGTLEAAIRYLSEARLGATA